jgi:hypothetical protein
MDRETLLDAIKQGPVRVHMNDGRSFEIPSMEFAIVDSIAAHVLIKEPDGKYRARILSLVCMTEIEKLSSQIQ